MARAQIIYLLVGLAAASFLFVGFALAIRALRRRNASRSAKRRARHAVEGERAAEEVLADAGYDIVDRQPRRQWSLICNGEALGIELRADLLAEREGRRYVVEVKTGVSAPQLANSSTRRQLLEYRVAYEVDAALLVDMEQRCITEVEFPLPAPASSQIPRHRHPWRAVIASALAGAAASASLTRWLLQ